MKMNWIRTNHLPDEEPNESNRKAYSYPQLLSGLSEDGQFLYDAIWIEVDEQFVLALLHINQEFGFIENEYYVYPQTRADLLEQVADFEQNANTIFK